MLLNEKHSSTNYFFLHIHLRFNFNTYFFFVQLANCFQYKNMIINITKLHIADQQIKNKVRERSPNGKLAKKGFTHQFDFCSLCKNSLLTYYTRRNGLRIWAEFFELFFSKNTKFKIKGKLIKFVNKNRTIDCTF